MSPSDGRGVFTYGSTVTDAYNRFTMSPGRPTSVWNSLGFYFSSSSGDKLEIQPWNAGVMDGWSVTVPLWLPAIVSGLLPAARAFRRHRRVRRSRVGLCPSCGYDLRATPDRCPECGTVEAAGR